MGSKQKRAGVGVRVEGLCKTAFFLLLVAQAFFSRARAQVVAGSGLEEVAEALSHGDEEGGLRG